MKSILACITLLAAAERALGQYYNGNSFGNPVSMTSYGGSQPMYSGGYGQNLYQRSGFMPQSSTQYFGTSARSSSSSYVPQGRGASWSEPPQPTNDWPSGGLPPVSGITEGQLFGSVDVGALTKPYASGDNSEVNEKPVRLPDIVEWQEGPVNQYDHVYPASYKTQEVVSNKLINTFTEQLKQININQKNIHRDYKAINSLIKYITNINRINHPSLLKQVLTKIQDVHNPYLYIINRKKDIINDSGHPVQAPLIVKEVQNVQVLPPIINAPIVKKYSYDNTPVWSEQWNGERNAK